MAIPFFKYYPPVHFENQTVYWEILSNREKGSAEAHYEG